MIPLAAPSDIFTLDSQSSGVLPEAARLPVMTLEFNMELDEPIQFLHKQHFKH